MGFAELYLSKHAVYDAFIEEQPAEDLEIIITIPAFNESGLQKSLDSLFKADDIEGSVEIITLINWPENSDQKTIDLNNSVFQKVSEWGKQVSSERKSFHFIKIASIPEKLAGAGFSRKILMDECIRRFQQTNNKEGIICSLDADTICHSNYLTAIREHLLNHPYTDGCTVYFEHPTQGTEFEKDVYKGIILYELHLRYYLQALRFTGHPNCYHTVGSAFAIKAGAYCMQGGMNKRKAGEDFYFLQKFFDLGRFSECNDTMVIPSPRPSDRVPFGTGTIISHFLKNKKELETYHPDLFLIIKEFISKIFDLENLKDVYPKITTNLNSHLQAYLEIQNFQNRLSEIIKNSSNIENFRKRFFRWFNMFRILKFLNYSREFYQDLPVTEAAGRLLEFQSITGSNEALEILSIYRNIERRKK